VAPYSNGGHRETCFNARVSAHYNFCSACMLRSARNDKSGQNSSTITGQKHKIKLLMLTSSLLTWTPDWLRCQTRCCCCCCCCRHAAVGTTYERRKQRQTHQTVNDVLVVRITSIRFFQSYLICALDNDMCVLAPTPGNHMQRCCRCAKIPPLTCP